MKRIIQDKKKGSMKMTKINKMHWLINHDLWSLRFHVKIISPYSSRDCEKRKACTDYF